MLFKISTIKDDSRKVCVPKVGIRKITLAGAITSFEFRTVLGWRIAFW